MDDRCAPHDDEETRITTSQTRYQQPLSKNARPQGVSSETGVQSGQPLRLQTSNKKELKAGISCNLCYIITSDNALMEQHLMGLAHISNVEKEARKCRDKIDFQKKSSPTNETIDAIASDVEESHCLHDRFDMVKSVIEDRNINNIPHCDETLTLSMKNKNNEVIKVQDKTMDETNNADCELCKYFQGDKYQIPEHFCPNFYEIPELPAGWTEKTSRTSGCSYYINNVTKVRQWNWPSQPAVDQLPHGWVEKKAKSNGLIFYVNKVTNDWQWDRPTKSPPSKATVDLSASTSKDAVINSDNSPGMIKAGMMVSKMKVTSCKSKQEALVPNEVEKLKVKSPIMIKTGVMISNLNESSTVNHEDQLKVDLMHWKQATEQWNSL